MVIQKIFGWILILAGLFFIIAMPSIREYMPEFFQSTVVFIGLILLGVGIFLLVKS